MFQIVLNKQKILAKDLRKLLIANDIKGLEKL